MTIGDKNYTEQFVLGELYTQALQAQGYTVQLNQNIGPTAVTLQALGPARWACIPSTSTPVTPRWPAYTRHFQFLHRAYAAAHRYANTHGLELLTATPFSDTGAIGVTVDYAQRNRAHTIARSASDRAELDVVGGPPEFQQ